MREDKFREIPFAVDIIFAGGNFRAKSKIAEIYSTRKIGVIQYFKMASAIKSRMSARLQQNSFFLQKFSR